MGVRREPGGHLGLGRRNTMTRTQLNRSIAARTGESLSVVRRLGFSLVAGHPREPRSEDLRLVLHCPFCNRQVAYRGGSGNDSKSLAECPDCDVEFEFDDCEVFPTSTNSRRTLIPIRSRYVAV
jgi:hypothetical protein